MRKEYVKKNWNTRYAVNLAMEKVHVLSGEEFHNLRIKYGISCQDVADVSKVSKQTVSQYGRAHHKEPTEIYLTMVLEQIISYLPKKED